jgi:transposase
MPKLLAVRELTAEAAEAVKRLAHSRTAAARLVERARIVWRSSQGWRVPAIAAEVGCSAGTVRLWLRRFDAAGLDGLADAPRAGCPATYTPEQVGAVVAAALTDPQTLGLPFGDWTYDRLAAYANEVAGVAIKRSRIQEVLVAEGLRWRAQETWFGARVDPDFAAKRGR